MRELLPGLVGHVPGSTVALALEDYKPFADEGAESGGGESKTVVWVRKLADLARSKDRNTRLQAALLMKQTLSGCSGSVLPRIQVVAVGVLLALVRQANTAWACSAMAIGALSELEQGLWRLGADAGGHREAAQLLGRYLPEGFKAAAALTKAKCASEDGLRGRGGGHAKKPQWLRLY